MADLTRIEIDGFSNQELQRFAKQALEGRAKRSLSDNGLGYAFIPLDFGSTGITLGKLSVSGPDSQFHQIRLSAPAKAVSVFWHCSDTHRRRL
jgi:hypothetical protein